MATTISIQKTIPSSSDWYTSGGDTTITLHAIEEGNMNIKKTLIKIKRPITKSNQSATPSDDPTNYVVDLKRIEETIRLRGWLADDASYSAWEQLWKIRAMINTGGALTALVIGDKTFSSSTIPAFIEEMTWIIEPSDTEIQTTTGEDVARLKIEIIIYLGTPR